MEVPTRTSGGMGSTAPAAVRSELVRGSRGLCGVLSWRGGSWLFENNMPGPTRVLFGITHTYEHACVHTRTHAVTVLCHRRGCGAVAERKPLVAWTAAGQPPLWTGRLRLGKSALMSVIAQALWPSLVGLPAAHRPLSPSPGPGTTDEGEEHPPSPQPPLGAQPGRRERTPGPLSDLWKSDGAFVASGGGPVYNDQSQAPEATQGLASGGTSPWLWP